MLVDQLHIYLLLFTIIVIVGQLFNRSSLPIHLVLVVIGMALSFVPGFPLIRLDPLVILDIFLPILVYQISAFASLIDFKKYIRPIALLSIGHVLFITVLIAVTIHALIPQMDWALAFLLGAVISPPDDVAIVAIAEKVPMPNRIITILEGEGLFNDAAALIIFRFALAAIFSHQFSLFHATTSFLLVVIGETLYGLLVGFVIGELRLRICNNYLHLIASLLTPFIAYVPAVWLGGSGVVATVITGFIIGNIYSFKVTPEFRQISRALWPTLVFVIVSVLFLLVGLNFRAILERISSIPVSELLFYAGMVVLVTIIGRFIWVYPMAYLPRLFPRTKERDPHMPWQYPLVVAWSGMRGSISLAAALAIPFLPYSFLGANYRDLIVFLVFCVIIVTLLLQGLTLPALLRLIGIKRFRQQEKVSEYLSELRARRKIIKSVLEWLQDTKRRTIDSQMLEEINLMVQEYQTLKAEVKDRLAAQKENHAKKITGQTDRNFLQTQVIEIERQILLQLWRSEKITLMTKNKLLDDLDFRWRQLHE